MDEISLMVSGNLAGAYSTGPRYGCDIRYVRAWAWNFARRAREGGLPRPRAYARQRTDVLIAIRVRSLARRGLADMVVRGLPLLHPTRPIMRC